jgi:hypothetical protein
VKTCTGTTKKSERCRNPPKKGRTTCRWHHDESEGSDDEGKEPVSFNFEAIQKQQSGDNISDSLKDDLSEWNRDAAHDDVIIHASQAGYGDEFVKCIERRVGDFGAFEDVKFVFGQVSKVSLQDQTDSRLALYKENAGHKSKSRFHHLHTLLPSETTSYASTGHKDKWKAFWQEVKERENVLFFVFQDEAHYGAKKGSLASVLVANNILPLKNVIHVCISATPYSIIPRFTDGDCNINVVPWASPSAYYDYHKLRSAGAVSVIEGCCIRNKTSCCREEERKRLCSRYADQFNNPALVNAIFKGQKVVIRARPDRKTKGDFEAGELHKRFQSMLDDCAPLKGKKVVTLTSKLDKPGEIWKSRLTDPEVGVVIIVGRFQMGDTFPRLKSGSPSVCIYDESLQFHQDSYIKDTNNMNYDLLHQELGRAYGYYPTGEFVNLVVTSEIDKRYTPPITSEEFHKRAETESFSPRRGKTAIAGAEDGDAENDDAATALERKEYHKNRLFIMWGQPQCGKTGAVLWIMKLLADKFCKKEDTSDPEVVANNDADDGSESINTSCTSDDETDQDVESDDE